MAGSAHTFIHPDQQHGKSITSWLWWAMVDFLVTKRLINWPDINPLISTVDMFLLSAVSNETVAFPFGSNYKLRAFQATPLLCVLSSPTYVNKRCAQCLVTWFFCRHIVHLLFNTCRCCVKLLNSNQKYILHIMSFLIDFRWPWPPIEDVADDTNGEGTLKPIHWLSQSWKDSR